MTRSLILGLVVAAAVVSTAAQARAQAVFVAPAVQTGGDQRIDAASRMELREAIAASLDGLGLEVAPEEAATLPCDEAQCFQEVVAQLGASFAITFRLWDRGDGESLSADVVLVDPDGNEYVATALDLTPPYRTTTDRLMRELLDRFALGPGPWLRVAGDPAGAAIEVDSGERGTVPERLRVRPGHRTVDVHAPGHESQRYQLRVPDSASAIVDLEVILRPIAVTESSGPSALRWGFLGGGIAVGLGLMVPGIVELAAGAEFIGDPNTLEVTRLPPDSRIYGPLLGAGAAVAATGIVLFFLLDDSEETD